MTSRPWLVVLAVLAACGGGKGAVSSPTPAASIEVRPLDRAHALSPAAERGPAPARSHLVGTIERRALGPFTARAPDGGLVAWIAPPARGSGQELVVVPTGIDGAPLAEPRVATQVPAEVTALVVRRTGGTKGGWLVAWSALLDRGESLTVVGLNPDGSLRTGPLDVQRTNDHVKWADLVAGPHGVTCVWAEETQQGDANVLAAPLDTDGRPHGMPVRVARGVTAWAAVASGDGIGLALVTPSAGERAAAPARAPAAGMLAWVQLDAEARPAAAAVPIGTRPTVSGDVDVVAVPGGWLLAWNDATGEDSQTMLAMVDAAGRVRGPRRAMDAVGGTELVGLAAGPAGAALAWQEPRGRAREMRPLHLAAVTTEGEPSAQPVTAIETASRVTPELVATEHGFALIASSRTCAAPGGESPCDGPVVPTFVRFDARLSPTQAEPLLLDGGHVQAALGWGLRCESDRCVALAASGDSPTAIYAVDLSPRTSPFLAPVSPPPPREAPRVTGVATIASGQPFADVRTTRLGDVTLVVTLTAAVDARRPKERRGRGAGATVAVRPFDDRGSPTGGAEVLSTRALSVGGVAIAASARREEGAVVAWVARDDGDPQVHLTHVDRRGRRTNEVQLTTARGDASDVAVAWCEDGWLVAWVDGRDGRGQVYVTKVDRDLNRTAREERITNAPGDAGDVALAVRGGAAWLAWSDARESPREGLADVYASTLRTHDARRASEETRVLATAAHSRSPQIVAVGDGALVAWIEDAPLGVEAPGAAMIARLDPAGHVLGRPSPLPLAGHGRPTSLALAAAGEGAHVVVARADHDEVALDAVPVAADATPGRAWRLLDLDAPSSFEVALVLAPDALYFTDIGPTSVDHRVRRAALAWPR